MSNAERPTSNFERKRHFEIGCSALSVRRFRSSVRRSTSLLPERMLGDVTPDAEPASFPQKMLQFSACHGYSAYCILYIQPDSHAITCC
jgi:hypothetical protein